MPSFVATQCESCLLHQVIPSSKSFKCPICGIRQSLKEERILGRSSRARELRPLVQESNLKLAQGSDPQPLGFKSFSLFDACLSNATSEYPQVAFLLLSSTMVDLTTLMSPEEIALLPSQLAPVLSVILDPQASQSQCIRAVDSVANADPFPVNPFLDHCLCFYILRRAPHSGPLEDLTCLKMLEIVSTHSPEALKRFDRLGQSLLFYACRDGRASCATFLISGGFCDPSASDLHSQTPAFYAAREGHISVIKILTEAKVDFDKPDKHGQTPLFYACSHGRESAADFLASEIGCDVGLRDNFRRKARNYLPGNLKSLADRLHVAERQKRKYSDISAVPQPRRDLPGWAATAREILRTGIWNYQGAIHFQKNAELGNIKRNLESGNFSSFEQVHEKLLVLFSKDSLTSEFYLQLVHCCGLAAYL